MEVVIDHETTLNAPPAARQSALPDRPLVVIRPEKRLLALDIHDMWLFRELLYFLTWRDVKVRYKQTVLGAAWAIIQPLFMMMIFTLFFGRLAGVPSNGVPYPVFAYAGLLPWMFFQNSVTTSGNSLVANANLISKVFFPRVIVPAAAVGAGLVDFGIAFVILALLMAYYQIPLTVGILALPLLVLLTALVALGVGLWMSALMVKYRDMRYALPFMMQFLMFATPVIYPSNFVPEKWRWVLELNPLTGLITGYRSALFGQPFELRALAISGVLTVAILIYAAYTFRNMEREFADII